MQSKTFFNNNEGLGGFENGAYDHFAVQPTEINWTRQSGFMIPQNPKLLWKAVVKDSYVDETVFNASFCVDKTGNIIVACCDNHIVNYLWGKLFKISPDGIVNELFHSDARLKSPVIRKDGNYLISTWAWRESADQKLLCISPEGTILWKYPIGCQPQSKPVIDQNGNIYIVAYDDSHDILFSIQENGTLNWRLELPRGCQHEPVISSQGVLFLSVAKRLYAINLSGQIMWTKPCGDAVGYPPVIRNDGVILYLRGVDKTEDRNHLLALSPQGEILWSYQPSFGLITSAPALGKNGNIMINVSPSKLVCLNEMGQQQWESPISGIFTNTPPIIGADGTIYQQSYLDTPRQSTGFVNALNREGERLWTYALKGQICSTVLAADNLIYILSNRYTRTSRGWFDKMRVDWELHAIGD